MKILRILLSTIFACIFAITVLVTAILGVFNEIFSQDYIMTKIEESGIYEEIHEGIKLIVKDYTSNMPEIENIFNEFVKENNIETLANDFSYLIYKEESFDFSKEKLEELLNENIDKIVRDNNFEITEEQQQQIDEVIENISNEYEVNMDDIKEDLETSKNVQVLNIIPNALILLKNLYIIVLVVTIILVALIIVLNLRSKLLGIDYIASGMIFSGIGLICLKSFLVACISGEILEQSFRPEDITILNLVKGIFEDLSDIIGKWGYIYLGIGVLAVVSLIGLYIFNKNKSKKDTKSEKTNEPIDTKK
ncbi:MAG: hypothetical protein HFJ45_03245 [Clostridia bacterium]|nr:hypothetical protein [Clostridia bacterium]